jgi:hydroxyacylglutathione hydrolase
MFIPLVVGPMSTNAYIFSEDNVNGYIIDPGGDETLIKEKMEARNLRPRGIICTHGHLDHTAAVGPLMEEYGRNDFFLAIHEKDTAYLGASSEETHRRSFASLGIIDTGYFQMLFHPSPEPDIILRHGETVPGTSLEVLYTPGHTEGSVSLYHAEEGVLFSGDTLFCRGIGRTDLPGGDTAAIVSSIQNVLFTLPGETRVYPGHGPDTDIESEKESNPFIR